MCWIFLYDGDTSKRSLNTHTQMTKKVYKSVVNFLFATVGIRLLSYPKFENESFKPNNLLQLQFNDLIYLELQEKYK